LGIEQLDLTLIHWSVSPSGPLPMEHFLTDLAKAQELGLSRLIGVSNFTIADLLEAEKILGPNRLATNQFERHPLLQNQVLVDFCLAHSIAVTCYLPLARGACAGIPEMEAIARAHAATVHQVALAYSLNQGLIVIPTSGHRDRIRQNFAAGTLQLTPADLATIASLDRHARQINPTWSPAWDDEPLS
jgi:2,5-diketo-D-gluconate reductase B